MKNKILIIYAKGTGEVFNRQSALGSYIHCLASILLENGYEVRLNDINFYSNSKQPQDTFNRKSSSSIKKFVPGFIKKNLKDIYLFSRLNKLKNNILHSFDSDVIIEFYSYGSNIGVDISKEKKVPYIVVYDSPILEEYLFFNKSNSFVFPLIRSRERKTLQNANTTIVYSNPVKEYVHKIVGSAINVSIHQNIDFSRFEFINDRTFGEKINIGFLGSFLKWHRVDLLLDVFIKLKMQGKNVHLYLLGIGEQFDTIKQKVSDSGLANDITLSGYVDREVLFNYKKKIDIGVMPSSNWYGAPNKIFEYGASKMAVVAPNTPTIIDLFEDKKDLILFENESFDGLYNSLLELIEDKKMMEMLANNLQQKIKTKYSKKNTFDFYNDLIKTVR